MKKWKWVSVILILAVLMGHFSGGQAIQQVKAAGAICYVDVNAAAGGDGSSWLTAYQDLQSALGDTNCTEIHVAAGTYYPGSSVSSTFTLKNGVDIIGGYLADSDDAPDPSSNTTTLDGNNISYHVVTGDGTDASAVLDGFTITNGNAMDPGVVGGGITIKNGDPTLRNLVINGNSTTTGGAGIYLLGSSPSLTDITISGNGGPAQGSLNGGGLWNDGNAIDGYGSPILTRVTFLANTGIDGGGMYSTGGNPNLTDVTFIGNTGTSAGGALYINGGSISLLNSNLGSTNPSDGNSANDGAGIYVSGGSLVMQNTTVQNGISGGNGAGMYIAAAGSATIHGSTFANNTSYTLGGGLYVAGSITMLGGSVTQNSASGGGGGMELVGTTSADFTNLVVDKNEALMGGFGGGIHAESGATAHFTNLLLSRNSAHEGGGMMLESSNVTIVNATIADNDGGGHAGTAIYNDNILSIANTIVWGNTNGSPSITSASTVIDSLLQDPCPIGSCPGLVSTDPQFVAPPSDMTPTPDYHLLATSPAVDAGDMSLLPPDTYDLDRDGNVTERISQDLGGKPRVSIGGVDIGAYEVPAININWTEATALPLTTTQPGVDSGSLDRYLDRQGQSQWFKVTVQPDSKLVVTLTNLGANYDLSLYTDISQAYEQLNTTQDLVKLSAEFAPDTFSPDTFSPDTFSPDTFSPDTFSPDTFSPDTFSPDTFSPDTFSPDTFSPDTFSPDTFSPDTFSPDTFSPDTFSPDTFSPDTFSPDTFSPDTFSPDMFSSAQTRSLIAVSAHDGTQSEGILVNTWTRSGDFYVRVKGRNGAFASDTPFHLAVTLMDGECGSVSPVLPVSDTALPAGDFQTLILTNLARTDGSSADITSLQTNLDSLAKRTNGLVLDVGGDARVKAAAVQAQANPGCVFAMNLQAGAIKDLVNAVWKNDSSLEYIVLVGNDHAIPFFRYPDNALLASETDYAPPVQDNSTSQASLKSGYFLSQDAYGSAEDVSYKAETIPVPDLAVGRLVETAADINHLLDAYLGTSAGVVSPANALVTGYDFLTDDANAVKTQLQASLGSSAVDSLIMDNTLSPADPSAWTADDLRQSLLGSRHDLVFLAGHFSASSALAADYTTRLLSSDVLASSTDFTNTLVYSAGCHSGYNIVNADDVNGVTQEPDWAQVFADKGATFIGGTGYQYGDTDFIAYSEQLYLDFTLQLRYGSGPVAVGQALVKAKQAYLAGTPEMRGIHEKALLEATLFGLPMLAYDLPGRTSAPVDTSLVDSTSSFDTEPGADLGLRVADLDVTPTFTDHTVTLDQPSTSAGTAKANPLAATVDAFYLEGPDGQVVNPAEPVLPLDLLNVTSPDDGFVLRGVGWRGGEYTDLAPILPLTGAATQDLRAPHVPFFSDTFYPVRPWNINYFAAISGSGATTRLALLPAQYRSSSSGSLTGILRRFDGMHFRLFYSSNIQTYNSDNNWSNTPALSAPPDISDVTSTANPDGTVSFTVTVTGDPAAGIQAVWIVYTFDNGSGSGTWQPLDLHQDLTPDPDDNQPHDSRLWKGTLALDGASAANLRFVVQAVNGVGLVTMMTNQGAYYQANVDPAVLPVGQQPVTLTLESPAASGAYGSQPAFTARLMQAGSPLSGLPVTFTLGALERLAVTGSDGRATANFYLAAPPADYTLDANFAGNSTYASADASSPFEITPGSSTVVLAAKDQTVPSGATPQFTATVTSSGLPLVGKSVALTLASAGVTKFSSVAVTDYTGQATWQLPAQSPGTYTLKAWFGLPVSTDLDLSSPYYTGSSDTTSLSVEQTNYQIFLPLVVNRPFVFKGFYPPVANPPAINKVEAGNLVPLTFSLGGNFGLDIFASGYPTMQVLSCQTLTAAPAEMPVSAIADSLIFNPVTGLYTYLWKTDTSWAGTCGSLVLKFIDGTQESALFQFLR